MDRGDNYGRDSVTCLCHDTRDYAATAGTECGVLRGEKGGTFGVECAESLQGLACACAQRSVLVYRPCATVVYMILWCVGVGGALFCVVVSFSRRTSFRCSRQTFVFLC